MSENAKKKASWIGWLVVLAAFILNLIPTFSQGALSPLAAEVMETYGLSQAQYVSLFTAPSLAPIFLSFVAGILLDKFGPCGFVLNDYDRPRLGRVAAVSNEALTPIDERRRGIAATQGKGGRGVRLPRRPARQTTGITGITPDGNLARVKNGLERGTDPCSTTRPRACGCGLGAVRFPAQARRATGSPAAAVPAFSLRTWP